MTREQAKILLATHHMAPRRYGTAFHLNPPVTDLRTLTLTPSSPPTSQSITLSPSEQQALDIFVQRDPYSLWQIAHPHLTTTRLIRLPENSQHTVNINYTDSLSQFEFYILMPDASLTIHETLLASPFAIRRLFIQQHAGSRLSFIGLRGQTNFLTERMQIYLLGEGAETTITHLTLGHHNDQLDLNITVRHIGPHTKSRLILRTMSADQSRTIYRGLIDVAATARHAQGEQRARALLANARAIADILPHLKIRTNDVQCSHGVTTTPLDEGTLFYLRTRGVSLSQAKKIAVRGFYHHQLALPPALASSLHKLL